MKTEVLKLNAASKLTVARRTAEVLLRGGICIIPTDTLYGIVALEQCTASVRRIYDIKNRSRSKPFIRLIGSIETLRNYTQQPLPVQLRRNWPGPLTILFRDLEGGTVGIRCPDDPFLGDLFGLLGNRGIVAPSANISGEEDICDCEVLTATFDGKVDLIVCREGALAARRASTIVDITTKPWRIVRQGAVRIGIIERGSNDSR
jgi:L-threonylcarbamoyladenylate synthase